MHTINDSLGNSQNNHQDKNLIGAYWLIDALVGQGVNAFFIAPGSRNSPLILAASKHQSTQLHTHYDERGLGFYALGYSKSTLKPSCVIVTSGSAVGNLLPAIMEASHSKIPLVIITADRPLGLQNTGAPQTTDQHHIFSSYVRWKIQFPTMEDQLSKIWVASVVLHGLLLAKGAHPGPIHFNIPYHFLPPHLRDVANTNEFSERGSFVPHHLYPPAFGLTEEMIMRLTTRLANYQKGIILIGGSLDVLSMEAFLGKLTGALQWPVFVDLLSRKGRAFDKYSIYHYSFLLEVLSPEIVEEVDCVLQIGDGFIANSLSDWLKKGNFQHIHVAPHNRREDPLFTITERVCSDIPNFIEQFLGCWNKLHSNQRTPSHWLQLWQERSAKIDGLFSTFFAMQEEISEGSLFYFLSKKNLGHRRLFIGNSGPIRSGDSLFFPSLFSGVMYGNRGLNGIDGNIGTIAGVAKGSEEKTIGIIGDMTFLHDLNSLPLLRDLPVQLIVINNNGGDIFSSLKISDNQHVLNQYFIMSHHLKLQELAQGFGFSYAAPENFLQLFDILSDGHIQIIEINAARGANHALYKNLVNYLDAHF